MKFFLFGALYISFLIWLAASFNHPYIAPAWLNTACWLFLAPSLITLLYIFHLSGKLPSYKIKKDRKGNKRIVYFQGRANFLDYILPGIVGLLSAWIIYLIPVVPTYLYAKHSFSKEVKVIDVSCVDKSRNHSTTIRYLDNETHELHSLKYPLSLCKHTPVIADLGGKVIKLDGRSWLLGSYIDDFYYPVQSTTPEDPLPEIEDTDAKNDAAKQGLQLNKETFSKLYKYRKNQ